MLYLMKMFAKQTKLKETLEEVNFLKKFKLREQL